MINHEIVAKILHSEAITQVTLRIRRMNHQCGKDIQDVSHPFAVAVAHDRGVEAEHLLGDLGKIWARFKMVKHMVVENDLRSFKMV